MFDSVFSGFSSMLSLALCAMKAQANTVPTKANRIIKTIKGAVHITYPTTIDATIPATKNPKKAPIQMQPTDIKPNLNNTSQNNEQKLVGKFSSPHSVAS
tara:strand:+ start:127 stop:426 length:300 start_codon:yes stop_codon:yes gene_type:complete